MAATIRNNPRNTWLSADHHDKKVAERRARHIERANAGQKRMCARELHNMYEGEMLFTNEGHVRCKQCKLDVQKKKIATIGHTAKDYRERIGILAPAEFHGLWKRAADDWHEDGLCRQPGVDATLFFPVDGEMGRVAWRRAQAAKNICFACPVIEQCREYALEAREEFGVFGGTTPTDRKAILAVRDQAVA